MDKATHRLTFICLVVLALMLAACASTQTELASWVDPRLSKIFRPRHVLVVAVVDNDSSRRIFESEIAKALKAAGTEATPSHEVSQTLHWDSKAELDALIRQMGADSVLIADLIGVEDKEVVHPPQTYSVPVGGYYGYYMHGWQTVHQPGYVTRHKVVRLESNLYDAATNQLVWSARSETMDPKNAIDAIDSVVTAMIKDLKTKGLIGG